MSAELLHRVGKCATGLAELDHAGLQIAQRTFNQCPLFLVMCQEVVPERVLQIIGQLSKDSRLGMTTYLAQNFRVP